eukprot:7117689-Prymnesium_polylepis.1
MTPDARAQATTHREQSRNAWRDSRPCRVRSRVCFFERHDSRSHHAAAEHTALPNSSSAIARRHQRGVSAGWILRRICADGGT